MIKLYLLYGLIEGLYYKEQMCAFSSHKIKLPYQNITSFKTGHNLVFPVDINRIHVGLLELTTS